MTGKNANTPIRAHAPKFPLVSPAAPPVADTPAMRQQRISIAQYKSPALTPTYLYERPIVFTLSDISFHEQYDRNGVVQDWLYATVTNADDGEVLGVMRTTAVMIVSTVRDVLANAQGQGVDVGEIGPVRVDKGERAYFLVDVDGNDAPF